MKTYTTTRNLIHQKKLHPAGAEVKLDDNLAAGLLESGAIEAGKTKEPTEPKGGTDPKGAGGGKPPAK